MRNNNKITIAVSLLALVSVLSFSACSKTGAEKAKKEAVEKKEGAKNKGPGRAPQAVSIAQIVQTNFNPTIIVAGRVQAIQEARIFPTSSGARVVQLLADAGDYVRAGQALARLDGRQINADSELLAAQVRRAQTSLAEAQVAVTSAREVLNRSTTGPRESALSIDSAEIAASEARSQYERALATNDVGALSREEVERRRSQMEAAEARLNSARGDMNAIMQSRRQGLSAAQARLAAAQADLRVAIAQQAQSNSRQNGGLITSPVGGLVTARNVSVGEIAGATGVPMFTITSNGALEVAAETSEADISRLTVGMRAEFRAPNGSYVGGTLRRLPAQIDPQKHTGIARFTLDSSSAVGAGVFLNGVATGSTRSVSALPATAILYDREGASVFVMRPDNSVTKQKVTIASRQGDLVELLSGPAVGSWVVTAGASFLAENEKIAPTRMPVRAATPASAPAPTVVAPQNKK
jgi:HlyD family secretion protein